MIDDAYNINGRSVIVGDCRSVLTALPDNHFDCIVTSPPYWGLRNYGVDGQIGVEQTLGEYLTTMVDVCRELRRVLKPQGTFWLNIGDSYHKKSLAMAPNRLAIMLNDDGWFIRSEIIWHKPNPMPEGVKNRPTVCHEKLWLLTKSDKYFYDWEAIKEPASGRVPGNKQINGTDKSRNDHSSILAAQQRQWDFRNARNVWSIPTRSFKGAHFAVMPPAIAERCIKAGCPEGGTVLDPFGGAGTTAMVAKQLGRRAVSIELNPDYAVMIENRTAAAALKETDNG